MTLGVKFEAELADQVELGFEEIDMAFLVGHQLLEQVAAGIVLDGMAEGRRLLIERARADFGGQVTFEDLLDCLADMQRVEHLHVGETVEEDDTLHELVSMHHLFDRFLAPFLGEIEIAPVFQHPVMDPILVYGGHFRPQSLVEIFDDFGVALHWRNSPW